MGVGRTGVGVHPLHLSDPPGAPCLSRKRPPPEPPPASVVPAPPGPLPPSSRASLRGVTRGILNRSRLKDPTSLRPCWLFTSSSNLDLILSAVSHPSSVVQLIFCRHAPSRLLSALAGDLGIPLRRWPDAHTSVSAPLGSAVLALSNVRVPRALFPFLERHSVSALLTTAGLRSLPSTWRPASFKVEHHLVGGVTTTLTHCYFALNPLRHPSVAPASVSVPVSVPRDVSTVLEFQPCPVHVPIPDPSVVQPLSVRVLPLGLHGGGLLGPRPTLETTVVTPARGARKGNWGVRPLSLKELLQIYDVGDKFLPLLL